MKSRRLALPIACAVVAFVSATALAGSHANATPITVNDAAEATPYPSTILVTGEGTTLTTMTATLTGINHTFPDDIDALLVGPTGINITLVSDACGQNPAAASFNLTFDDAALAAVPDTGVVGCPSGSYKPANYGTDPDTWPSPAPKDSGATALSSFNGTNPNGQWALYLVDDEAQDDGSISGGWSLNFTTTGPTAAVVSRFAATQRATAVFLRWRTADERHVAGFHVYRSTAAGAERLNRTLIRARHAGTAAAGSYSLRDAKVRAGTSYTYRLELVRLDGSRVRAGSSALRIR